MSDVERLVQVLLARKLISYLDANYIYGDMTEAEWLGEEGEAE